MRLQVGKGDGTRLLFVLIEHPREEVGIVVGFVPDVVTAVLVLRIEQVGMALHVHINCTIGKSRAVEVVAMRIYDRPTESMESIDHIPRILDGNKRIKRTVKIPDRHTDTIDGI